MIKPNEDNYEIKESEYAMIVGFANGTFKVFSQTAETFMQARQIVEMKFENFNTDSYSLLGADCDDSNTNVVFIKSLACNAYLEHDYDRWSNPRSRADEDDDFDPIRFAPNPHDITKDYFTFKEIDDTGITRKNLSICIITGKVKNDFEHVEDSLPGEGEWEYDINQWHALGEVDQTGGQNRLHTQFGMRYPFVSKEGYEFVIEHVENSQNPDPTMKEMYDDMKTRENDTNRAKKNGLDREHGIMHEKTQERFVELMTNSIDKKHALFMEEMASKNK